MESQIKDNTLLLEDLNDEYEFDTNENSLTRIVKSQEFRQKRMTIFFVLFIFLSGCVFFLAGFIMNSAATIIISLIMSLVSLAYLVKTYQNFQRQNLHTELGSLF
ncbi:hypothetical protein M0813_00706 [Anaeramoeba flamelloides]|uniref:Uncharacterized protein n=1 Tax=Anaeramoeba flamelloides TaxID=1746091 RepID=A0AAV8AAI4_9EUKA|nr:hypothetical protein M0812_06834 [Anaeramoeba flamelloides]KAJ6234072.1 hypothetical protein M0813_00706 [Anaeramoeba flamelloides]